jgi:hypothetical protein
MKSRITNNLEEDFKNTVEREFETSYHLRKRLREMLNKDMDNLFSQMKSSDYMEKENWPLNHASLIGEARALQKIISLLE